MKRVLIGAVLAASGAAAQDWVPGLTVFGGPGMVEMPSAYALPDGEVALTASGSALFQRGTLAFQAAPRVTAAYRLTRVAEPGPGQDAQIDRSFDLHIQLMSETASRPAVALGFRDLFGTDVQGSEYLVASKRLGERLQVSAGLGFGRLGTRGGFELSERPAASGPGGNLGIGRLFRGDAAVFAGLEYNLTDRWRLAAEYSSDGYDREVAQGSYDDRAPVNVALSWRPLDQLDVAAYTIGGSEFGVMANVMLNPAKPFRPTMGKAPVPFGDGSRAAASWGPGLVKSAKADGLVVLGVQDAGTVARVRVDNTRFRSEAQGIGRLARRMSQAVPATVQRFQIELMRDGVPVSRVDLSRADLRRLEARPGGAADLLAASAVSDAGSAAGLTAIPDSRARFEASVAPALSLGSFGRGTPAQVQAGLAVKASYRLAPSLRASGELRYMPLRRETDEVLGFDPAEAVRRDGPLYGRDNDVQVERLTLTHRGRLAPSVYTQVTGGLLERAYGGLAAEVLWKPATSRLGLGGEVVYARKRDYDMRFGFQEKDAVTAHLSAYYEFDGGYLGRVDVGRYLAGDLGATVSVARAFANGWRVGAYATLTDMPFSEFGEGAFDKGIRVSVPTEWFTGKPSRASRGLTLSTPQREGGARVDVGSALYDSLRTGHQVDVSESWGRVWK